MKSLKLVWNLFFVMMQSIWLHIRKPANSLIKTPVENTYAYVWKSAPSSNNKHVILFLSGLYSLNYHGYMCKTVEDLLTIRSIADKYQFIVYENPRKSSLEMQSELAEYIHTLHRDSGGLEELILFGFSAGGILASHVMHELTALSFAKKIITYDTPLNMIDVMRMLNREMIAKFGLRYFHYEMVLLYRQHSNYEQIKSHIVSRYSDLDTSLAMVEKIHGLSREQLNHYCHFQPEQSESVEIINIYCKYDPIVCNENQVRFLREKYPDMKVNVYNMEKPMLGHCSDMVYGRAYLNDIIHAIERNNK